MDVVFAGILTANPSCPNADDYSGCPNNSSTQGQIFYSHVSTGTSPFNVYSVDGCQGPEGVPEGHVPALSSGELLESGVSAIENDMAGTPGPPPIPGQCTHRAH